MTSPERLENAYRITDELVSYGHKDVSGIGDRLRLAKLQIQYNFLPHYLLGVPEWRLKLRARGNRVLPDFACVGTIRSGTSDVATYLLQHPSIMTPLSKEPASVLPEQWRPYYPTEDERSQVEKRTGAALNGIFNPRLHNVRFADAFSVVAPRGKAVILLRNPAERAYSHYKWDLTLGGKTGPLTDYGKTFKEYVDLAIDIFPGFAPSALPEEIPMLHSGIYLPALKRWVSNLGRENILVVQSEDFFREPTRVVGDIQEFLGLQRIEPAERSIVNKNRFDAPIFDEESRKRLIDFYRPWNEKLYEFLGKDLGWN